MRGVIIIPLHIGDLLAGTMHMDTQEFGAHMRLLIAHYKIGKDGLPCDEKKLARIAGVTTRVWRRISPAALENFHMEVHPSDHRYNRWINDRCIEEINEMERKSETNRVNALKRYNKGSADAQQR